MASKAESIAATGWATYSSYVAITADEHLNLDEIAGLLSTVERTLHQSANRVRHCMNGFVIAVGSYVPALTDRAIATAQVVGKVSVDMGGTACQVPSAAESIAKAQARGKHGVKRKSAAC